MATYSDLEKPVSAEQPCGPDPDLNPEIQNFLAVAEGQLPASYRDFNKKAFDAKASLKALQTYLAQSRDLRFLVMAAKYHILADELTGYADAIAGLVTLVTHQWESCHPTEAAGGADLRQAYLKSLDDMPTSVLPLQNLTLLTDKRVGVITVRAMLIAAKQLTARAGETALTQSDVTDALMRFEPLDELVRIQANVASIITSLSSLRQIFVDKVGYDRAPQFKELPDIAHSIQSHLAVVLKQRVPNETESVAPDGTTAEQLPGEVAPTSEVTAPSGSAAEIASVKEASNALQAILDYYAAYEPSSPARLLLKQAHQLVGKSFVEAMKILAPALVEKAKIQIGGDSPFSLSFAQLTALAGEDAKAAASEGDARSYTAATRAEASQLMRKVEQFYRQTEPSSPIPLLIERARYFVAKDFAELLKEMAQKNDKP
jgi:type VI secretion system protein ImpA